MQERWRTWGANDEYAEQGASARRRSLVANGYESPTVRQWYNYGRDGFRVATEPGSGGWRGYFILGKPSGVTYVESLHVGLVRFRESMRTAKGVRRRRDDPTATGLTDPSSEGAIPREWIVGGPSAHDDVAAAVPPPIPFRVPL